MRKTTAVILAAGMGKRLGNLTKDKPKPLLEVFDKTLIEHSINFVKSIEVNNIIVIGGYLFDKLKEKVNKIDSSIEVVENKEYESQNLISFKKGISNLEKDSGVFVYDADHVFNKTVSSIVAKNMTGVSVYCSFDLSGNEEDIMKARVDDKGCLIEMSKKLKSFNAIYTGMFFIESAILNNFDDFLSKILEEHSKEDTRVEIIFKELINKGINVKVVDVGKSDWIEIDTEKDLDLAKNKKPWKI